jgi:tetratricopeptide (TPR) repeat protein
MIASTPNSTEPPRHFSWLYEQSAETPRQPPEQPVPASAKAEPKHFPWLYEKPAETPPPPEQPAPPPPPKPASTLDSALEQFATPKPSPPLDDALKAFATAPPASPLNAALQDFAKTMPPKPSPPPIQLPPKVAVADGLDISPQTHLRAAYAYVEEVEQKMGSVREFADTTPLTIALMNAGQHLAKARAQDPDATYSLDGKDGPIPIGHDFLAAETLHKEGLIGLVKARLIDHMLDTTNAAQGKSDLRHAVSAWEKAAAYRPRADFYTYMAEAHLKLDNIDAANTAMKRALQIEPGNLKAVQFLDAHAAKLSGVDTEPPPAKKPMKLHWKLALGGLGCFVCAMPFVGSGGNNPLPTLLAFSAFGLWAAAVYVFRKQDPFTQSKIPGTYDHWKETVQRPAEMRDLEKKLFHQRYEDEKKARSE